MLLWQPDAQTRIYPLEHKHTKEVYDLIRNNREHLDQWLRWSSAIQTEEDVAQLIGQFEQKLHSNDGFMCGIWLSDALAGAVVCWYINAHNSNTEIGYWLGKAFTGRGLATTASQCALSYLFDQAGLHRVEMQCGVENIKSRAVPERLGFKMEGIRRESHWITNRYVDHAVYGLLGSEWNT